MKELCPGNADYWGFLYGTLTSVHAFTATLWADLVAPNKTIPSRVQSLGTFPVPRQAKPGTWTRTLNPLKCPDIIIFVHFLVVLVDLNPKK